MKKIPSILIIVLSIVALTKSFAYCLGNEDDSIILFFLLAAAIVFLLVIRCKKIQITFSFRILTILFHLLLLKASFVWLLDTFPLDDAEQVLLTLQMPTEGFSWIFIKKYLTDVFFVFLLLAICLAPLFSNFSKSANSKKIYIVTFLVILLINVLQSYDEIPLQDYCQTLRNENKEPQHSAFWDKYYIASDSLEIESTNTTRNLIFIVMESMENYPREYIPEIYLLTNNYLSFGHMDSISATTGGHDLTSTGTTIQALVAKTTGIPLLRKRAFGDTLMPKINGIFNILNTFGYTNVFIQGTNGSFAGKKNFMINHGMNAFYDIDSFRNDINKDYNRLVTFTAGVTDFALYEYAKLILDTLQHKEHFSLSLLTVETHFPYGFYDEENCSEHPSKKMKKIYSRPH